jgi:hypothetical protein
LLVGVRNFALFVKFLSSFGKVMNFSTIFTFDRTLAHVIGFPNFFKLSPKRPFYLLSPTKNFLPFFKRFFATNMENGNIICRKSGMPR